MPAHKVASLTPPGSFTLAIPLCRKKNEVAGVSAAMILDHPFGVGLGNSHQKFNYLPEHNTDFIFSSLAEQRGFLGASILLQGCIVGTADDMLAPGLDRASGHGMVDTRAAVDSARARGV